MHARHILAAAYLAGLVALPACSSGSSQSAGEPDPTDPSIVIEKGPGVSDEVENGTAHDRATIDLGTARKVALPDTAAVRRAGEARKVQLFMAKTLSFAGHPPESMSVRGARKNMGCAIRIEGDALVVATYGEWDSRVEGGAHLKLVAVVPAGVEVERRNGLSGPDSTGHSRHGQHLSKPKGAQDGYWYGPASPAEGWTAVPAVPDVERTAGK